ncbi:MAG: hypothetical protein PHE78_07975 [Candidatus Gastranaerophilales bacterium]|nr:hypothetical protein [Candidatus Gastranaerophilales bacterium]
MIKKTFLPIGLVIFGGLLYFAYLNQHAVVEINYLKGVVTCDLLTLLSFVIALSALATVLIFQGNILELEQKLKKQARTNEKSNIVKEESQDKICLLEAKIQTLEKALEDALKRD